MDLVENEAGGAVSLWGMVAWCWEPTDVTGRRLAAVGLVATGAATQVEVAAGFGVDDATLRRWSRSWEAGGTDALAPERRGPKGPTKLDEDKVAEIRSARREGLSMEAVAIATGVSLNSVSRVLRGDDPARPASPPPPATAPAPGADLVALARPEPRTAERQAARAGLLAGAPPVLCEGASLPMAGALLVLPALVATGVLDAARQVYQSGRAAFYGLSSLFLAVAFSTLVGEPRAEGLSRLDPVDLGRLLGLDRAPEMSTMRRRMQALARLGRSGALVFALARHHLAAHADTCGIFYVDGHVRAYHGAARLPKAHLSRMRLAMPATVDTWICDGDGDGVLVWTGVPGACLGGELRRATAEIRSLVGPEARPVIAFDRGGWSPRLFAELTEAGFHILTYRKGTIVEEPRPAFSAHEVTDATGRTTTWWLADREVTLEYKQAKVTKNFACRQVTRLDPETGHQTQIITTITNLSALEVAKAMFSRWRQENFFRSMGPRFGLDALDSYAKVPDDASRSVPNPAKAKARAKVAAARSSIAAAESSEGRASLDGGRSATDQAEMAQAFAEARAELAGLEAEARAVPARVRLGELHPDAVAFCPERKRIHDAIRMATFNAESSLARLLGPHYARADDEARSLLREAFRGPADLQIAGDELHVRLNPLSAPRRSRAIAGLCAELNTSETIYPGTKLRLVYSVKDA